MKKPFSLFLIFILFANGVMPSCGMAQILSTGPSLPQPGEMVPLSPAMTPAYLKGMVIDPKNPFKFDFIVFRGDKPLSESQKKVEYTKLIKYFLAALAVPDEDQWVNLSPYEKNRIILQDFGLTQMGGDLLGQDYILKQLSSSLTYPESPLGRRFWSKVYAKAKERFGTTNVPASTFNKVWIVPDKAVLYEKGDTVYILENHLKVLMQEDYLSLVRHSALRADNHIDERDMHVISSQVMRETIIPSIEKEVNEGSNFARLRQVYSGMLLATWYKRTLKDSILGKLYVDKGKVRGIDQDPRANQEIYKQYLKAFKKGVFNMIKEDFDPSLQQTIARKYFSGGTFGYGHTPLNFAQTAQAAGALLRDASKIDFAMADLQSPSEASLPHQSRIVFIGTISKILDRIEEVLKLDMRPRVVEIFFKQTAISEKVNKFTFKNLRTKVEKFSSAQGHNYNSHLQFKWIMRVIKLLFPLWRLQPALPEGLVWMG